MKKLILLIPIIALISCYSDGSSFDSSGFVSSGQGGSLARFAIQGNDLYLLTDREIVNFDINNPFEPVFDYRTEVGEGLETIFPYADSLLFLGSQFDMQIYTTSGDQLRQLSFFSHATACDPVVVDFPYAYVTLRSNSCGLWGNNELHIIDVSNLNNSRWVNTVFMSNPYGLGVAENLLFVCEDDQGLVIMDRTDPETPFEIDRFNIPAIDVIPRNNNLMVTARDGIYQYGFTTQPDSLDIRLRSYLSIE